MSIERPAITEAKKAVARHAAGLVENGMKIGLGSGSTSAWLVRSLGKRVREEGLRFSATSTSLQTAVLAREHAIHTVELDELGILDMTIDGADEIDPGANLIKGGGGALLREKITASSSERVVIIVDESKCVPVLGAFPLPVEVVRFGWESSRQKIVESIESCGEIAAQVRIRQDGQNPFVSDDGHYILDVNLGRIESPERLAAELNRIPGVVENGLFIGMCDTAVVGRFDGSVDVCECRSGVCDCC